MHIRQRFISDLGRQVCEILALMALCFAMRMTFTALVIPRVSGLYSGNWDPDLYGQIAENILQGHFAPELSYTAYLRRGPGYPVIVAIAFAFLGKSLISVQWLNALLTSCAVPAVYYLGVHLGGSRKVGIMASLLYCFWIPAIWYTGRLNYENLTAPVMAGAIALFSAAMSRRSAFLAWAGGILGGVAALANQTFLYVICGLVFVTIASGRFKQRFLIKLSAMLMIGILVVVLPWTLRNYLVSGGFVPVHTGGAEVHLSGKIGTDYILSGGQLSNRAMENWARPQVAQMVSDESFRRGYVLSDLQADRYLTQVACRQAFEQPQHLLIQMAVMGWGFWFLGESVQKTFLMLVLNGLLLITAFIGLSRLRAKGMLGRALSPVTVIVLTNLAYALAQGESRYSVVLAPLMLVLTACGMPIDSLRDRLFRKRAHPSSA